MLLEFLWRAGKIYTNLNVGDGLCCLKSYREQEKYTPKFQTIRGGICSLNFYGG